MVLTKVAQPPLERHRCKSKSVDHHPIAPSPITHHSIGQFCLPLPPRAISRRVRPSASSIQDGYGKDPPSAHAWRGDITPPSLYSPDPAIRQCNPSRLFIPPHASFHTPVAVASSEPVAPVSWLCMNMDIQGEVPLTCSIIDPSKSTSPLEGSFLRR